MTKLEEENNQLEFVKKAAKLFSQHKGISIFSEDGKIRQGKYFAVRWGADGDCVVIFKIDPDFEPINYMHILK